MRHIKYPKTEHFRNTVKKIDLEARYIGKDEQGVAQYDMEKEVTLPKIRFRGTVKTHGTNSAVCVDQEGKLWAQSRNRIITPKDDRYGFAAHVESHKHAIADILDKIFMDNKETCEYYFGGEFIISLFGEWIGKGIHNGAAVNQIPQRSFIAFAAKISSSDPELHEESAWVELNDRYSDPQPNFYTSTMFNHHFLTIDFNKPEEAAQIMSEYTQEIEDECPVGKAFGVSGIGEGIVWESAEGYRFKTKGEKHSGIKKAPKVQVQVTPEVLAKIEDFVGYAVNEGRLQQGIEQVFGTEVPDVKGFGKFIKWVSTDIKAEETDVLEANGLVLKDVEKALPPAIKKWFWNKYV